MTAHLPDSAGPEGTPAARPRAEDVRLRQQFAALAEGVPRLVWMSADGGQWTWSSPLWTEYTGLSDEFSRGLGWCAAVHPDDRAAVMEAWNAAPACGLLEVEHRLLDRSGGEARWFRTRGAPLPAEQGQAREWLGTCTDVDETRALEEREQRLLSEPQRRVCGVLSLVRLVVRRTGGAGGTAEAYAMCLEGRLDAIGRTQLALARAGGAGVDLEGLVLEEALAHAAHEGGRVRVCGPAVALPEASAGLFGLAVHELMANAAEHGALSVPGGHVEASWRVEEGAAGGGLLRFEWREAGVRVPDAPRRGGFGTELIGRLLARELGAEASHGFGPDGATCTVLLPLPAHTAPDPRP